MSIDLTFRAQTPATLAYALKRPMMQHLGIVFPQDEAGTEITNPDNWKPQGSLGPDIDYSYLRQNDLVVSRNPVQTDPYCWLLIRIIRDAEDADRENNSDTEPDRWKKSKVTRMLKESGMAVTPFGVQAWQHTFPQNSPKSVRNKRVQIIRGFELATLDIFPEFMGESYF